MTYNITYNAVCFGICYRIAQKPQQELNTACMVTSLVAFGMQLTQVLAYGRIIWPQEWVGI